MATTLDVVFDGKVFTPDKPVKLEKNKKYRITVEQTENGAVATNVNVWDTLEALAGSVEMPEDWSEEHDHYLYGTPKRNQSK